MECLIHGSVRPSFHNICIRLTILTTLYAGGRVGTLPGLCTGALICSLLQWGANELEIARVRYVSQNPYKPPAVVPITMEKKGLTERVFTAVGFKKISDEEHLVKLRATRDSTLIQIEKLEAEEAKKSFDEEQSH